ncbi:MAG: cyclic nucleotide-binding domain-containing protein [Gammaproteobacteria bacterium]|nr:cyclic nucleotide-binding domain-containing protein [Gammaproteobacteria bacterium]
MAVDKKVNKENKVDLIQFLDDQVWCDSLTIKEVKIFLEFTQLVSCERNEIIAEIGEVGEALYLVISGEVALYRDTSNSTDVGRIKEGEIMGEMSFFDRRPRSVRLEAVKKTQLLKLSRSMYQRLRVEHPYIALNLLEHAVVSLDHLFRRASHDMSTFANYLYALGRK